MKWEFIVALVVVVPVVLLPVAYIWYFNLGGIYKAIKAARTRKVPARKGMGETVVLEAPSKA